MVKFVTSQWDEQTVKIVRCTSQSDEKMVKFVTSQSDEETVKSARCTSQSDEETVDVVTSQSPEEIPSLSGRPTLQSKTSICQTQS